MITELMETQLTDVFRIGLLIALFYTMLRTRAVSGTLIPLAAGIVFVAVMLPMVNPGTSGVTFQLQALAGLASNTVIVAILYGLFTLWEKLGRAQR